MPSTNALEVFIRKGSLSDEEWFALVHQRARDIKRHLDNFTLKELGDVRCLRSTGRDPFELRYRVDEILGSETGVSLQTQGIYFLGPYSSEVHIPNSGFQPGLGGVPIPDGSKYIWGLTRACKWLLAQVDYVAEVLDGSTAREAARKVSITYLSPEEISRTTKEPPRKMWEYLGQAVRDYAECRRMLYESARELAEAVADEECLARHCDRVSK